MPISAKQADEIRQFCIERDAVLHALDPEKMVVHAKKWAIPLPAKWASPTVPMAMMHKARLHINSFTDDEKRVSREWLLANGYRADL